MDSTPLIDCIASEQLEPVTAALRSDGYTVLVLDGSTVHDGPSFRAAVSRDLLGAVTPALGWDACVDALRNRFDELESTRMAVLWTHAQRMLSGGLLDLLRACDLLTSVARDQYESGRTVIIRLLGDGANFPG